MSGNHEALFPVEAMPPALTQGMQSRMAMALNSVKAHTYLGSGSLPSSASSLQRVADHSESCPNFIFPQ